MILVLHMTAYTAAIAVNAAVIIMIMEHGFKTRLESDSKISKSFIWFFKTVIWR